MPDIVGRLRSPRLASAPASPAVGEMYYNSTTNVLYYWNGTAWVTSGSTSAGTPVLAASLVSDVGVVGQIRAGRQLTAADFTALGLSAPRGLWNLSDLTDASGNARALTNKGAVTFASGINGTASTAAQFTGSTAQALYIVDTGAADPFRITAGSWGSWFRTAKRGVAQDLITKRLVSTQLAYQISIGSANNVVPFASPDGSSVAPLVNGVSDVCDDRWHFAVAVYDGAMLRLYVDAVLEAMVSGVGATIFASSAPLNIGGYGADGSTAATEPNYGRVDEAFVTADVLSPEQVRALYCAKFPHGLTSTPAGFNLAVRRQKKGAPLATTDFPTQPLRLHNFTAGALTDQGSNNVALTNNNAAVAVVGADGVANSAFNFVAASSQSLSSTDAGLPVGTASRSFGAWLKTTATTAGGFYVINWGATLNSTDTRIAVANGSIVAANGTDTISGPFVADGQWHSAVVIEDNAAVDGVKRKLYVDGQIVGGSTVLNAITLGGANKLRIGATVTPDQYFTGQIDRVFVCGYALTQDQVSILYAKGSQALAPSPKNAGDHVEFADATSIYAVFDTLESQHQVDLAVTS